VSICRQCNTEGCCSPCGDQDFTPKPLAEADPLAGLDYLRVTLRADVNGWDIDECEAKTHRELFELYAEHLREDARRHQRDADRLRELAEYADRLALVEEP